MADTPGFDRKIAAIMKSRDELSAIKAKLADAERELTKGLDERETGIVAIDASLVTLENEHATNVAAEEDHYQDAVINHHRNVQEEHERFQNEKTSLETARLDLVANYDRLVDKRQKIAFEADDLKRYLAFLLPQDDKYSPDQYRLAGPRRRDSGQICSTAVFTDASPNEHAFDGLSMLDKSLEVQNDTMMTDEPDPIPSVPTKESDILITVDHNTVDLPASRIESKTEAKVVPSRRSKTTAKASITAVTLADASTARLVAKAKSRDKKRRISTTADDVSVSQATAKRFKPAASASLDFSDTTRDELYAITPKPLPFRRDDLHSLLDERAKNKAKARGKKVAEKGGARVSTSKTSTRAGKVKKDMKMTDYCPCTVNGHACRSGCGMLKLCLESKHSATCKDMAHEIKPSCVLSLFKDKVECTDCEYGHDDLAARKKLMLEHEDVCEDHRGDSDS